MVSNKNNLRSMRGYLCNYITICLYSYAGITAKLKDTISLCIEVPCALLTWSLPSMEANNNGLQNPF